MGESNVSTLTLEQSVSFGKFENDSLSWEKWSSFSPNKYLDEVEKCSTPGSVAEKKAYFEAHYKKIAAKKAELEQDNLVRCAPTRSEELNHESYIDVSSPNVDEFDVCGDEKSNVEAEQIAQQKAYFEELYIKIADRMGEHVEQDTPMQYAYPMLEELKHKNHADNLSSCDYESNPCSAEKPNVEHDQIAQKKAFFEAQLTKMDGWRTERLKQDHPLSSAYQKFDESQHKNHIGSRHASDCTFNASSVKKITKLQEQEQQQVVVVAANDSIAYDNGGKQEIGAGESLSTSVEEAKDGLIVSQSVYREKLDQKVLRIEAKDTIVKDGVGTQEISAEEHLNTSIEEAKVDLITSQSVYTELVEQGVVIGSGRKDTIVNDGWEKQELSAGECHSTSVEEAKENSTISQLVYTGSSDSGMALVIADEPSCVVNPPDPLKLDKKVYSNAEKAPGKEVKKLKVKEQTIVMKKVPAKKEQKLTETKKKVVPSAAKSSLVSSSKLPKLAPSSPLTAASNVQPLTGAKKKLVTSAAKSSQLPTPRPSKLAPPSPSMSASKLSTKKLNATYLPKNKNITPLGENKRAGPTSLHMSLHLDPSDLSVEPASTQKSLIMERMADKDIIKRAFSSFKNNFRELRSSYDEKSIRASNELDRKVATLPQKDSDGLRKAADKRTPTRGQSGIFSSVAPGVVSYEENKRGKTFSPSADSKSEEGADKRKDFVKKLGPKLITRDVEKVQTPTKSKGKDGETKLLKKNSQNAGRIHSKG